jgi:hypothetical protein
MEAIGLEIGREETRQRRALNKAFLQAIKNRAKGSAWRVSKGVVFRDFDGWFIAAPSAVWLGKRRTQIELKFKPMTLDPIFWEIVEAETNVEMPLSFRYWGAWTCSIPALVEHELDERGAHPTTMAHEAIDWLDAQVEQFKSWTTEKFLDFLREHPRTNSYLATVVTTMFLLGDFATAETLCKEAIKSGDRGGFSVGRESGPSRSFPELALAWLERKRRSTH